MATRAEYFPDDEIGRSFEEEWPELARRLDRFLGSKGVEPWLRADVIQETAARLYPRWRTLDHSDSLWNLVATIAVRVVHTHRRKESRIELVADPLPIHRDDVDVRGLQRVQLDKTRAALQQLNLDQRRVLLAEVGEGVLPDGTRNRINVLRLRARARLREALGPWAPAAIALRLRYLRTHRAEKRLLLEMSMPALANSIANVAIAATIGLVGVAGSSPDVEKPMQLVRGRSSSPARAHDVHLGPMENRGRPEPPNLSRSNDGTKTNAGVSGPAADAEGPIGPHKEWADRRQQEVRRLADDGRRLADDGRRLADDGRRVANDARRVGREQVSNRQEELKDRRKEAQDRRKEVEDLLR